MRRDDREIDYYGVFFAHLVPENEADPEVWTAYIIEMEKDGGKYARQHLHVQVNPEDCFESNVLPEETGNDGSGQNQFRGRMAHLKRKEASAVRRVTGELVLYFEKVEGLVGKGDNVLPNRNMLPSISTLCLDDSEDH
ncbi:hypothetical protein BDY21DRAFT_367297 [Lineolata rhizophorae]|uniref:Uncharacterized protein n=1 Tax=Lineolata rhizophorae TaxID=578093 RepID=A0A6A6NN11_9PEZI|nr:hypothetical protein BDY21DRAFT_367297 [Lineolata rhizophorae]